MVNQPHLRPVEPPRDGEPPTGRQQPRQRATKAFPTDRLKMDRQIAVLGAIGRLSGPRKESVNGDQLSRAVGGVAAATVILSNKFFVDAGWIETGGRGLYSATDVLVEYTRRLATGSEEHAAEVLREPARQAWFWVLLEPYLANGRLPLNDAVILLMREANASGDHQPMIRNLIAWLEYIGLITVRDQFMVAVDQVAAPAEDAPQVQLPAERPTPAGTGATGGPPTTKAGGSRPPAVVSLILEIELTAEDLAQMAPEQIKVFFEAVGTVAAVKNKE